MVVRHLGEAQVVITDVTSGEGVLAVSDQRRVI